MKYDNASHYTLSTGRKFYAFWGLLSPFPESGIPKEGDIAYGLDSLAHVDDSYINYSGHNNGFTDEERQEIAEYMIGQWKEWAKK